jgi:hypothetical protein
MCRLAAVGALFSLSIIITGCGGGSMTTTPIAVSILPSSANVPTSQARTFTATVTHDTSARGVVYYEDFYKNAMANPEKIAIGAIKKGFDDNNASWGTNRVTAQQCGQTLLKTIGLISNYYDSRHPLEFLGGTYDDIVNGCENDRLFTNVHNTQDLPL